MRNLTFVLMIVLLPMTSPVYAAPMENPNQAVDTTSDERDILEKTVNARGTEFLIQIDIEEHTLTVDATHFANNTTSADFSIVLNDFQILKEEWKASAGDKRSVTVDLMPHYQSNIRNQTISFGTYGAFANISYNYTVPRESNGQYLRPTITDVSFERVNQSWGRMTVTLQSDSRFHYPSYVRVWTPNVDAKQVDLFLEKGENVTRASILLPVAEDEPFEGEIRLYPRFLNESGPIHTQYEFYGKPGSASLTEVPYEPLSNRQVRHSYEYRNESVETDDSAVLTEAQYRLGLGAIAVVLMVGILGAVLVSRRRQGP